MPYATVDGTELFYTDVAGSKPALLLVHGWACDSHDWNWQFGPFIAAGHRVIAVDNRGHGRSQVPSSGYDIPRFAADLAGLIDQLDAGPVIAIGHSLGGFIVSSLAVEHPDHVQAVVVVDPGYGHTDKRLASIGRAMAESLRDPSGFDLVRDTFAAMEGPTTPDALRFWHGRRAMGCSADALIGTLAGIFDLPPAIGSRDAADTYLAGRKCPVLAIHNVPAQAEWETTTFQHPKSTATTFSGTGHWLHQERPDEFNTLVLEWIEQLTA